MSRVEGSHHAESRLLLVGRGMDEVDDIEAEARACQHAVRHVRGVQCSAVQCNAVPTSWSARECHFSGEVQLSRWDTVVLVRVARAPG